MKKKLGFSEISPQLSIKKQILKNSSYNRFLSRKIDKRLEIRIRKPPLAIRPHTLIKKLLYHQNTLYDNPNPRQKTLSPKPYQTSDDSPGDQSPHYQLFLFRFLEKSQLGKKSQPQMCYQGNCFQLEIADTPEKRELGLMFRESLPEDQGMLFVFDKSDFWSFWMRNTLIPLDILWIDAENRVVDFASTPPCKEAQCPTYLPKGEATQAIELNSGTVAKLGLQIGEKVKIRR